MVTGTLLWQNRPVTPTLLIPIELQGLLLPEPKPLTQFKLTGQHGEVYDLQRLQNRWTFLFFGYTHCPDVCPTSLGLLAEVFEQLKEYPGSLENTQATFISVDPKRDTPQLLKEYVPYFHEKFNGATGQAKEIAGLAAQVWAQYSIGKEDADGNYEVEHTAAFFLIDPKGRLYAVFPTEFHRKPKDMAKAFNMMRSRVQ